MGSDNKRFDEGNAGRIARHKIKKEENGFDMIPSSPLHDLESTKRNFLACMFPDGTGYTREMSAVALNSVRDFDNFASQPLTLEVPLEDIRCSDFILEDGKMAKRFANCHNLAELRKVIGEKTPETKTLCSDALTWKLHLTKEQYQHIETYGRKQKPLSR
jgi:hypothetical protein